MKETIYTIPINEVYDGDFECPLCALRSRLEEEAVEYALGAAMMEPDFRIESNEKGYCQRHFSMLFQNNNKLSLALVLDTHLEELRAGLEKFEKSAERLDEKGGLFKKSVQGFSRELCAFLDKKDASCAICDKIDKTMERYVSILLEMWATESDFKEKFAVSKGACLPHFNQLVKAAAKNMKATDANKFISLLAKKQAGELLRIQEDIHKFTLKFDYRNADMEWGTAKDAPIRTIEKIAGRILKDVK